MGEKTSGILRTSATITCYYLRQYNCDFNMQNNTLSNCFLYKETFLGCVEEGGNTEETDWIDDGSGGGAISSYEDNYAYTSIQGNSEDATATFGPEEVDQQTGKVTRNAGYRWKCGSGSTKVLSDWYKWDYISYETGALEKINNAWLFRSDGLAHSSIQRVGQTAPSHEMSHELGYAYPNIALDKRTARMDVKFVVYEGIVGTTQVKSWEETSWATCKAE